MELEDEIRILKDRLSQTMDDSAKTLEIERIARSKAESEATTLKGKLAEEQVKVTNQDEKVKSDLQEALQKVASLEKELQSCTILNFGFY